MSSTELEILAENEGISIITLRRAKKKLGVISYPKIDSYGQKTWFTRLKDEALQKNDEQQGSSMSKNAILTCV